MSHFRELPRLDCHAHIAPDITPEQVRLLGDAVVFAVSRTIDEGYAALKRRDDQLVWGWGAHPTVARALDGFTEERAAILADRLPLVGEIGLDRRGPRSLQQDVFCAALRVSKDQPVLISIHSTGCVTEVIDTVRTYPHPGIILHWFLGSPREIAEAVAVGCYFSVNAAMPTGILRNIPPYRVLPETDFPAGRRSNGGQMPGDTEPLEALLADIYGASSQDVRRLFWKNLRRISMESGALNRYPDFVSDILLAL